MNKNLINIAILQLGWWTITLTHLKPYIYILVVGILLLAHLKICTNNIKKETLFIFISTIIGCFADWVAIKLNLYNPVNSYTIFPLWLICYWLVFSTSFSLSLSWLKNRWLLISVLGFIMAPLTYFAGEKFDLLLFNKELGFKAYLFYGLVWFIAYPILFKVHQTIYKK